MKVVCIDCRYVGNKPSGIGEVTWALVRNLPQLAPDIEFLLLRNAEHQGPLSDATNVREVSVRSAANSPTTLFWLPKVVDLSAVDLFHAPFNILPAHLSMKTLTTIHDIMWLTNPQWCNPRLYGHIERRFYARGINHALQHSDAIATVSHATRAEILKLRPDLANKVSVTFSGVSETFQKVEVQSETLRSIGLPAGQEFILTTGQYAPYKNHEAAIKSFAKAFKTRANIHLVMVQRRNAGARKLVALAQTLGVADRVHFTGAVSSPTLLELYSGALALLHPSLCEGFGNPLAEAMACGCPVITSNLSAMPEVTGGAALLVDPRDIDDIAQALVKVASSQSLRLQMSEDGLARANQLSWQKFAHQNLEIYRRLLA